MTTSSFKSQVSGLRFLLSWLALAALCSAQPTPVTPSSGSGTGDAVLADNNTFTGVNTFSGSFIRTPATIIIAANTGTIDVTKGYLQASNNANTTLTPSAAGTHGQFLTLDFANSDTSAHTVTVDTATDFTFTAAASSTTAIIMRSDGSGWLLVGGAPTIADLSANTTPAATNIVASQNPTTGATAKSTITQVLAPANIPAGTYVDGSTFTTPVITLATLASDDTYRGTVITGYNAGATIAQWDAVYLDASSTWQKADNDGTGTFPAVGIAVASGTAGDPLIVLVRGVFRDDGGTSWTVGGTLYLSSTPGAMTSTAPGTASQNLQTLGTALSAHVVYINPSQVYFTN